jgi:hypothetical protein
MAAKPNAKNWNDIQIAIVSLILMLTLVLWNSFASPDRVKAEEKAAAQQAEADILPEAAPFAALTPTPLPQVVIMFSDGATPTPAPTSSTVAQNGGGGGRNRGGGGTGGS